MEQFKRAKVIMLPTEKSLLSVIDKSRMFILEKPYLSYSTVGGRFHLNELYKPQHLYIISDDEIKEGDWCLTGLKTVRKCKSILYSNNNFKSINGYEFEDGTKDTASACKKIIATTDTSLKINSELNNDNSIKFQLPQPSQQFIEKYIESYNKGIIISDVLVEYDSYNKNMLPETGENINVIEYYPKINHKDNTITIKKLKDSWSREEIIILLNKYERNVVEHFYKFNHKDWIEENL